jgi:hypothetical protein
MPPNFSRTSLNVQFSNSALCVVHTFLFTAVGHLIWWVTVFGHPRTSHLPMFFTGIDVVSILVPFLLSDSESGLCGPLQFYVEQDLRRYSRLLSGKNLLNDAAGVGRARIRRTEVIMKKPILLFVLLIVAVLAVYVSTRAQTQKQFGAADRLHILKVDEGGIRYPDYQAKPDVIGFSCAAALDGTEPTCYALLRDRVF